MFRVVRSDIQYVGRGEADTANTFLMSDHLGWGKTYPRRGGHYTYFVDGKNKKQVWLTAGWVVQWLYLAS